jgi:hypothetical protein
MVVSGQINFIFLPILAKSFPLETRCHCIGIEELSVVVLPLEL